MGSLPSPAGLRSARPYHLYTPHGEVLRRVRRLSTRRVGGEASPSPDPIRGKHLAEKILPPKAALEGERRLFTVPSLTEKGSTWRDCRPRSRRRRASSSTPAPEHMMEAAPAGTRAPQPGDGVMESWRRSAPRSPTRLTLARLWGVDAALNPQESVRRYADGSPSATAGRPSIQVSGGREPLVIWWSAPSRATCAYGRHGRRPSRAHLAARMQQLADPARSCTTPETLGPGRGLHVAASRWAPPRSRGSVDRSLRSHELCRTAAGKCVGRARVHAVRGAGHRD